MNPTPLVSVVIPAYNHGRYVAQAIESVQAQTLRALELVVVDDGSRDDTAAIAERIAAGDRRIRVLRQPNGGSHAAIMRGIAESGAPWIAILNSDDRHHPDRLARMLAAAGDAYDFAVSGVRLVDADGEPITDASHWWLKAHQAVCDYARAHGPIDGLLYGNYTVSTSNFLMRRSLYEAVGRFSPRRHVLDWDYALRAALHAPGRFLYLQDEPLLDYRIHGGNAILSGMARGAAEIGHLHRRLMPRLGVPPGLVSALFRAQRDLRRHARQNGAALRAAEVEALAAEAVRLREACAVIERIAREREADRRSLAAEHEKLAAAHGALAAEHRALAEEVLRMRASLAWRVLRRLGLTGTRY